MEIIELIFSIEEKTLAVSCNIVSVELRPSKFFNRNPDQYYMFVELMRNIFMENRYIARNFNEDYKIKISINSSTEYTSYRERTKIFTFSELFISYYDKARFFPSAGDSEIDVFPVLDEIVFYIPLFSYLSNNLNL